MTNQDRVFKELEREAAGPAQIHPPTLERVGVGYRLVWPEIRVEIVIPRVHWHREDAVAIYGISILPALPGRASQRIDHGSLNLYASRTRASLAKQLHDRWPADWGEILSQASAAVLEQETMGEDPIELGELDTNDEEDSPRLLGGLCLRDDPTMLFGHGGDGKSYLALAAAISIVTGRALLAIEPAERRRVAYLDWEWGPREHRRRIRRLTGDESFKGLLYFRCRHPLPQEVDRLSVQFRELDIGYAIVDSVAWACGGAPEESGLATAFQSALRTLGVGTLSVAHTNRSGDTSMPFGSVYWHNGMRATWYAKKQQEAGDEEIQVGLFNRKSNGERLERPIAFTLDFRGGSTAITKVDPGQVAELASSLSLRDRMVALLRQEPRAMTYTEVAAALSVDIQLVRNKAQQDAFVILPADAEHRSKRIALAAQTGLETSSNQSEGRDKPINQTTGGSLDPRFGLFGSTEVEQGVQPQKCPSCGFDEYQPLGDGRRKCLRCEAVWEGSA